MPGLNRTVSQVVDLAKQHEEIDPTRALQMFNEAHQFICGQLHLYPITNYPLLLTAGQAEYPLGYASTGYNIIKIWQANLLFGPTGAWQPIRPSNVDTLYNDYGPGWQLVTTSGTPAVYYERGGNIGFYPTPQYTSSGGYPNVTLECDTVPILTFDDVMPDVDTIYPWVYYMCFLQVRANPDAPASSLDLEKAAYWNWFKQHMEALKHAVYDRTARDHPRVSKRIPRVSRA